MKRSCSGCIASKPKPFGKRSQRVTRMDSLPSSALIFNRCTMHHNLSLMNTESQTSLAFIAKRNNEIASLQTAIEALESISTWGGLESTVNGLKWELNMAIAERDGCQERYDLVRNDMAVKMGLK